LIRAAGFGAAGALARPEHAVEAMAQLFELEGFKLVEAVAGQECADQVRDALEDAVCPRGRCSTAAALAGEKVAVAWGWGCSP
jgi:hypothetical protein